MKLTALQALVAAIEEGSLRSAARRIGVSQPALTKLVRELEVELAAPLLERHSKGVRPTPQGQVMFEHALKVSRELASATDQIQQLGGQMRGELNVAAVPVAMMLLIPETLRTYSRTFPDIRLRVSEELFIDQLQKLRSGQVDLGKRPPCTVLDLMVPCRQMSITWLNIANGTRQPEPPSHSTEAVR